MQGPRYLFRRPMSPTGDLRAPQRQERRGGSESLMERNRPRLRAGAHSKCGAQGTRKDASADLQARPMRGKSRRLCYRGI